MKRQYWIFMLLTVAVLLAACSGPEARRDEYLKSASEYFDKQQYEEAKVQVKNAIKVDNKYGPSFQMLGKINYELKLWRDSLNNYGFALELDPTLIDSLIGQGRIYLLVGELKLAAEAAEKALALDGDNPQAQLVKAATIAREGDQQKAMEIVEDVVRKHSREEEAYAFLGLVAFQAGELDKSIVYLEKGVQALPSSSSLKKQLAGVYFRAGRIDDAERVYNRLMAESPDDFDLQRMVMRFYLDSDNGEKALSMAKDLERTHPDEENYTMILSEVYARLGDEAAQEQVLRDALAKFSPGYDIRIGLAVLLTRKGLLDEAAQVAGATAEIDPGNEKAIAARRLLVDLLVRQVKYEEASAELDKVFELSPGDMEAKIFKGRIELAKGDPLKAIGLFRQVLDEQPDMLAVYGLLSQAHYINGEVSLAKDTLVQALQIKPDFAEARTALINLYLADGEFDRALGELRDVARQQPGNLAPVASMGDVFMMQDKYDEAGQRYRRLLKMEGGTPLGLYKLGQMESRRKNYDMALDYFSQLLAGAPQAFQAAEAIVGVYLIQNQYDNALAFCDKLLEKGPNPGGYDLKARVEAARGNLAEAEALFFKAKEIEPRWRDPYQMVGAMYLRAGKTDVAIQKFQQALKESPDNIGNAYVLGMLYQEQGKNDDAAKMYEYALEKDSNFLPAVNNLAYLYADTSKDQDKLNRALALALRAAGRSSSATLDTLGWVYFKTGNNSMALSTLLRAMEMDSEDPVILLHLAQVHAAMGTTDQARTLAEKVADWPEDVPEKAQAKALLETL